MALIEDINGPKLSQLMVEPENVFPGFIEAITNHIYEITMDEIEMRKRI